jgi:mycothiol synthase
VLGVHPRAQGRGYGRLLLEAGLSHLIDTGTRTVDLYVDAADRIAVRMYERAGFAEVHRDVLYARTQE